MYVHPKRQINSLSRLIACLGDRGVSGASAGRYNKKDLEATLERAILKANGETQMEFYRHINQSVLESLGDLSEYEHIVFVECLSPDVSAVEPELTVIPRQYAIDPMGAQFAQTDAILAKASEFLPAWEGVLLFYISPVLWPCFIDPTGPFLKHAILSGEEFPGSLSRALGQGEAAPNFMFDPSIFILSDRLERTKRKPGKYQELLNLHGTHEKVEYALGLECILSSRILASALKDIVIGLGKKKYRYFALETGYLGETISKLRKELGGVAIDRVGVDALVKDRSSPRGTCHPQAINKLHGNLVALYDHRHGTQTPPAASLLKYKDMPIEFAKCDAGVPILCSSWKKCMRYAVPCAFHRYISFPKETQNLLSTDCRVNSFGLFEGIEAVVALLKLGDFPVESTDSRRQGSWKKLTKGSAIEFIENRQEKPQLSHMSPSVFNMPCMVARMIAVYRDSIPVPRIESELAKIGTAAHSLMLDDLVLTGKEGFLYEVVPLKDDLLAGTLVPGPKLYLPSELLRKAGCEPRLRSTYCEGRSVYRHGSIVVSGRYDSAFMINNEGALDLVVIDLKHSEKHAYPTISYKLQLLSYGLGLASDETRNIYLVLVNRPFLGPGRHYVDEGNYRLQEITVIKVDRNNDPFISILNRGIESTVSGIDALLSVKARVASAKMAMQEAGRCKDCFSDSSEACKYIIQHLPDFSSIRSMLNI